ncbi:hypothetical protein VAL01S_02_00110 [Vibrio alginolyticus NBRC 15630 = ATCC 17749]|nr:hypothetical protein YZOS03_33430 [Vibrio alginolyticus]GAD69888.1 hypothetical protein VAL01S_02_00110 [Vibrio alginolyticus NBRC 15630 = ATCC 17749]
MGVVFWLRSKVCRAFAVKSHFASIAKIKKYGGDEDTFVNNGSEARSIKRSSTGTEKYSARLDAVRYSTFAPDSARFIEAIDTTKPC